jgi:dTDP-rhamnose C3-O-methyltransferase
MVRPVLAMGLAMLDNKDGFKKAAPDIDVERRIADHCARFGMDPLTAVKHFPVLARRQALKRFFAHVDLFKMTLDVPGDIAELGVFRGLGLFTWANLLEAYCIGDRTKVVYGFDNWHGFSALSPEDASPLRDVGKVPGGFDPSGYLEEVEGAIAIFDSDRFIPGKPRIKLIKGEIEASVPQFVEQNPGVRFSLVHFDCDLYLPTKVALNELWERISRGGVLIFDEYGIPDWPGETAAVDEFVKRRTDLRLYTFAWTNVPGAYLVKS